jgi:hypothetical protein
VNQLMLQAEGESLERWKGAGRLWRAPLWEKGAPFIKRARPFGERGALVACLVGGLVISSFSFMQLRVDDN